jgi:uracil-DNA glycosylase family 4
MSADGEPGGILFVAESPGRAEDASGRPLIGPSGTYLRKLIAKHYQGPMAFDNGIRCAPGAVKADEDSFIACRGYLKQTIMEVQPERIIALGAGACYSLLGRSIPILTTRRGYAWLTTAGYGPKPTPVFITMNPAAAMRNRFVQGWFEEDLAWALTCDPVSDTPKPPWTNKVHVVTKANVAQAVAELETSDWFAYDIESAGLPFDPGFEILCLGACSSSYEDAWVWDRKALADTVTFDPLVSLLTDKSIGKLAQNGKFDNIGIRYAWGVKVRGSIGDTRLWRKLAEPEASGKLEDMAELVGMGGLKEEAKRALQDGIKRERKRLTAKASPQLSLLRDEDEDWADSPRKLKPEHAKILMDGFYPPEAVAYALLPDRILLPYCGRDVVSTARLGHRLWRDLGTKPSCKRIWDEIVSKAAWTVEQMEYWGIPVAKENIENLSTFLTARLEETKRRIDIYDEELNPDSSQQVGALLFDRLKLKPTKLTPSGKPSTDASVLEKLAEEHQVVKDILEWRSLGKLKGTYADGLYPFIRSDGRIHPDFKLDGTRSGRPSCSDPNLLNIPRVDKKDANAVGNMVKACFVASPGHLFLQFDMSQVELRVAAMLSDDPVMKGIFRSGVDFHLKTAKLIAPLFNIDPDTVDKDHWLRTRAKIVNFGILYGKTASGFAKDMGITIAEAERVIKAIMGQFKRLAEWIKECIAYTKRYGCAWTQWDGQQGRYSPLWRIAEQGDDDEASAARSRATNGAVNRPVQGSASEFCLASLIRVCEAIVYDGLPAKLVLTVYDSILLEVQEEAVDEVASVVEEIMVGYDVEPRMEVDIEIGRNWGALEKYRSRARKPANA